MNFGNVAAKIESASSKLNRLLDEGVARVETVFLDDIWEAADRYQSRERTDDDHVKNVMCWMAVTENTRGQKFVAPIVLFEDPDGDIVVCGKPYKYRLSDGFHRVNAARILGWKEIPAIIIPGGDADCLGFSVSANLGSTSKPVTDADKRKSVRMMLTNPAHREKSSEEIAVACGCDMNIVRSEHRILSKTDEFAPLISEFCVDSTGRRRPRLIPKGVRPRVRYVKGKSYRFTFRGKVIWLMAQNQEEADMEAVRIQEKLMQLDRFKVSLKSAPASITKSLGNFGVDSSTRQFATAHSVILSDGYAIAVSKEPSRESFMAAVGLVLCFSRLEPADNPQGFRLAVFVVEKPASASLFVANRVGVEIFTPEEFIVQYKAKRGEPTTTEEILERIASRHGCADSEAEHDQDEAA